MVDRIDKALFKMTPKERAAVLDVLDQVKTGQISKLDLKKLQGHEHAYRVRKGPFRIIFEMVNRGSIRIIDIQRRSDTTYDGF